MTLVSADLYDSVRCALCRAIGDTDYFSGSVAAADGSWRLTTTVLVTWATDGVVLAVAPAVVGRGSVADSQPPMAGTSERKLRAEVPEPVEVLGGTAENASDGVRRTRAASGRIVDLIPVWWEFHTWDESGETYNDFSFARMKQGLRLPETAA